MTSQVMTTEQLRASRHAAVAAPKSVEVGLTSLEGFELAQRIAKMLAASTMVPEVYRDTLKIKDGKDQNGNWLYRSEPNPNGLANCVIALNMANRMGADPLMIMQNLYIVEGRPAWSSQFVIGAINTSGKYSPLRFDVEDRGEVEVTYTTKEWKWNERARKNLPEEQSHTVKLRNMVCKAWAIETATGERLESAEISMEMAVKEGWYQKNGSKWQTMPEQMLRYRAASFFGRIYAPEVLMGIRTQEEEFDAIIDVTPEPVNVAPVTMESIKQNVVKKVAAEEVPLEKPKRTRQPKVVEVENVQNETSNDVEKKTIEEAQAAEVQEQVVEVVIEGKTSDDLRKEYSAELNKADSRGRVNELFETLIIDNRLKDSHKEYLRQVADQCRAKFEAGSAVDPIKSNSVKSGLQRMVTDAQTVADLEQKVAPAIRENKPKMTQDHMAELLTEYAARKKFLEDQQDMFAGVDESISYADAVIKRIEAARSQDDINAEFIDPAFEELSDKDKQRINLAAQKREAELMG